MHLKSREKLSLVVFILTTMFGLLIVFLVVKIINAAFEKPDCRIIYDAGSSGTRLFIYEKKGDNIWQEYEGKKKTDTLAAPIRGINGKKWEDADQIVTNIINMLIDSKINAFINNEGNLEKADFDWSSQCEIKSLSVYATAGMRIAEQSKNNRSKELWGKLRDKLKIELKRTFDNNSVEIEAKTITGFEEGLYAWLSIHYKNENNGGFGLVEMGGASSQIAFPCSDCDDNDKKKIVIDGKELMIFSYSFLGLGGDEAFSDGSLGPIKDVCQYDAKNKGKDWEEKDCAKTIEIKKDDNRIIDPYNFDGENKGTEKHIPTNKSGIKKWVLTGAFQFMNNIKDCCYGEGDCSYDIDTSCFRSVYYKKYLKELGVQSSTTDESSWTLGAVICKDNDCLKSSGDRVCRWMENGDCLSAPNP